MGSVQKKIINGTNHYYAVYNVPGRKYPKWETGGKLKKNAQALLARREMEIANGTYGRFTEITFKDLADKFLKDYCEMRLKPRTLADYSQVCKNHLVPYFGKHMALAINRGMVQEFIKVKLDQGLTPRTVNKLIMVLGKIYVQAIKWDYVSENPARFIDKPRQERKEMDFLRPHEVRALLAVCDEDFKPHLACAILTGMRQGEQLALLWSDVDFKRGLIHIRRHISAGYLTEPKTFKSSRTVVMSPDLADLLVNHRQRLGAESEGLIFPGKNGEYMKSDSLTRRFGKMLVKAGLRRIRWHDLRHTYASSMIAIGENIKFLQHQLGHTTITTTMDRYGHLLPEATEGIGALLDSFFNDATVYPFRPKEPASIPLKKSISGETF